MTIAVVGVGAMGANHARVVWESPSATLGTVVDTDLARARAVAARFGCHVSSRVEDAAGCDAAIVATTTDDHVAAACDLIAAGVPVLVEKPVSERLADVERLLSAAEAHDIPLMCGFVERFNPVVTTMVEVIDEPVRHFVAIRHSPPNPTPTGVVHDLLIHDLDLAIRLADGSDPVAVAGVRGVGPGGHAEAVDCTMRFPTSMVAAISANRASQRKLRMLFVETGTRHWELDLLRATVTVYRHVRHEMAQGGYRAETAIEIPYVRHRGEPLALQLDHFLRLAGGEVDAAAERRSILPAHRVAERIIDSA